MNTKSIFWSFALLAIFGCASVFAQEGVQTRSIPSDDFQKKRPARARTTASRPLSVNFRFVGSDKSPNRRANANAKPKPKPRKKAVVADTFTDIGVTVWKLRPPVGMEAGYMLPVQIDEDKEDVMWLAERVRPDASFTAGDRVRFAIEASVPGYLYIFDREIYSNGTFGAPELIFPESLGDDNYVEPGLVADIPDHRADYGYLRINPRQPNHKGEFLTVIVSPRPLQNLSIDEQRRLRNVDLLEEIEIDAETEIFTRTDTVDRIFTKTESNVACGVKTRQLDPIKTAKKPCSNAPRLGPDETLPQSLYRVKTKPGGPAVIFVKLETK